MKLKQIRIAKSEDVYDITIEKNHNFFANNVLVHNCEISLKSNQFCNLTEISAGDILDQADFEARTRAAAFIGTLQAGYTSFHYLRAIWRKNQEKDSLLGVSMTGIASGVVMNLDLKAGARVAVEENKRVAAIIGINPAARVTTTKPSGCMTPDTLIKTSVGDISLHDLFDKNNVDYSNMPSETFIKPIHKIFVKDHENNDKLITSLFINGVVDEFIELTLEDDTIVKCTPWHKFMTSRGWVRADELLTTDNITNY